MSKVAFVTWWTYLIWGLGMTTATLLLLAAIQALAWKVYRNAVGWSKIRKAILQYSEKHPTEEGDLK